MSVGAINRGLSNGIELLEIGVNVFDFFEVVRGYLEILYGENNFVDFFSFVFAN